MPSKETLSHHTYVEKVLKHYKDNDITPGDPNEGVWHQAHFPLPKHLGNQTVLLLAEHHAVQGVLQSEEFQTPCIWNWEKNYLNGWLLERFHYWRSVHNSSAGKIGGVQSAKVRKEKSIGIFDPETWKKYDELQKKRGTGFYSRETKVKGGKTPSSRLCKYKLRMNRKAKEVLLTRVEDGHVFYFESCNHAEQVLGLSRSSLLNHLDKDTTHKGYKITTF